LRAQIEGGEARASALAYGGWWVSEGFFVGAAASAGVDQ
jgi:hypothetical protein